MKEVVTAEETKRAESTLMSYGTGTEVLAIYDASQGGLIEGDHTLLDKFITKCQEQKLEAFMLQ